MKRFNDPSIVIFLFSPSSPSMANPNQPVRTCILKVDLKCCTGCQNKAKTKLLTISGVTEVEYNQDKGLLTVTGDVEPLTLVHKLTKCHRKTELVSVNYQLHDLISDDDDDDDDEDTSSAAETSSNTDPNKPMEGEPQEKEQMMVMKKKKKKGLVQKVLPFGCFNRETEVFQPIAMRNQNRPATSKSGNVPSGQGYPFANPAASSSFRPPWMPYPPMGQQYPQVHMPYNANMYLPPTQPYSMSGPAHKVNPRLHYM